MTLNFENIPTGQFIHNEWVEGKGSARLSILEPATGKCLTQVSTASPEEVQAAIISAQAGFKEWSNWPPQERAKVLNTVAKLLREYNEPLAKLETRNTGKPIQESIAVDIISGAECFEFFAAAALNISGHTHSDPGALIYTRREPLGVVASIGAWNYPIQIACWKAAPALACGNSMVYKPSELTPVTTQILAQIFIEAGLPPGVFNVVHGDAEVGGYLTQHPSVAKISLTGSVPTGKAILKAAADHLTPVSLELGGKSPLIVFDSADIDNAVSGALLANFYTQGEICSNGTRIFVHDNIYEAFVEAFVSRAKTIAMGDPLDVHTQIGPLINQAHAQRVKHYISLGIKEGATLACGVNPDETIEDQASNFVPPTIFTNCEDHMRITQEEIFGPVACVLRFNDEEEVISRANNTEYGLAAGVFTRDITQAHRVVDQLQAGVCWINQYNITPIVMPFGGVKASGMGRENGLAALNYYTQLKSVYLGLEPIECPYA